MGLTSLLTTKGLFGNKTIVEMIPQIAGINRMVSIASTGIFALLPMIVAYSATKRFGGRASLGLAIGAVMIHPDLANAFSVAGGSASNCNYRTTSHFWSNRGTASCKHKP